MALDRQKILNELGSVMNQLKNTDCGCMGKLFGDSGRNAATNGVFSNCSPYKHGCCHGHGYNPSCGEPHASNAHNFRGSCLGRCNPPKLYADTYNYLTENLMQPTINEVYNDLHGITPANTIMNSPVAKQMGIPMEKFLSPGTMGNISNGQIEKQNNDGSLNSGIFYAGASNIPQNITSTNNLNSNNMGNIGGMGPQIMNMFGEKQLAKSDSMPTNNQYNNNKNVAFVDQPLGASQLIQQPNIRPTEISQQIRNMNSDGGLTHQIAANKYQHEGQHAQGIAKFNEMFPGVMKNGDLGFDPMAIAIQMNPANQKQAAFDTIHKLMNNNNGGNKTLNPNDNTVQPGFIASTNYNQYNTPQSQTQNNIPANDNWQFNALNQQTNPQMQQLSQQQNIADTAQFQQVPKPITNKNEVFPEQAYQNVFAAVTNAPLIGQQQQQPIHYQQQRITDPNTNSVQSNLPTVYEKRTSPNVLQSQTNQIPNNTNIHQIIKDPILPVDTSKFIMPKQKYYNYNTLGQPVEMLPGKMYHTPEPSLPQTLSPQVAMKSRHNYSKYSNVKSTESKTSLMGNKPVGKCPSRNQLQQIYNQYKGSQSFTHQNIKDQNSKNISHSEGRFNLPHNTQNDLTAQQMPIENVGGDTVANKQINDERTFRKEHIREQIGDAPVTKQPANEPEKLSPVVNRKYRNGLQDMVYTSYPTSAAWSFHGHGRATLCSSEHRYRNKI
ncbi:homeobox protein 5-like [Nymphalis io]|uniref:homeobox protein 5-like n=1 Tax=Inachis io TaxID=171585 RepID=UPI00216A6F1D|nr:homeobox protein 5-like [Nymphalis io]